MSSPDMRLRRHGRDCSSAMVPSLSNGSRRACGGCWTASGSESQPGRQLVSRRQALARQRAPVQDGPGRPTTRPVAGARSRGICARGSGRARQDLLGLGRVQAASALRPPPSALPVMIGTRKWMVSTTPDHEADVTRSGREDSDWTSDLRRNWILCRSSTGPNVRLHQSKAAEESLDEAYEDERRTGDELSRLLITMGVDCDAFGASKARAAR